MEKLKPKKCKNCQKQFAPFKTLQPRCIDCAIKKGRADTQKSMDRENKKKQRDYRAETKNRRNALKSRSDWMKDCQKHFNAFIRERDKLKPCISCQRHHAGQYHAGHYRSVGSTKGTLLRFNELNCHKQCFPCNHHLSANIAEYRINLIKKIGLENVELIEGPHEMQKLSIDEIQSLIKEYKKKLKELQNEH